MNGNCGVPSSEWSLTSLRSAGVHWAPLHVLIVNLCTVFGKMPAWANWAVLNLIWVPRVYFILSILISSHTCPCLLLFGAWMTMSGNFLSFGLWISDTFETPAANPVWCHKHGFLRKVLELLLFAIYRDSLCSTGCPNPFLSSLKTGITAICYQIYFFWSSLSIPYHYK